MSPWRAYLLMCRIILDREVPHWTGTHGEMISSDLHGVEEPTRWMLRPQQGQRQDRGVCTGEEEDVPQRHPGRALPRGVVLLSLERWPWKALRTSPRRLMTSSNLGCFGEAVMAVWHVWQTWRSPRRANVLLQEATICPKMG
jgi:hypothetical protein